MFLLLIKIVDQMEVIVPQNVFMPELHESLGKEGAELLVNCIEKIPHSLLNAKPQSDQNVSFGKRECIK